MSATEYRDLDSAVDYNSEDDCGRCSDHEHGEDRTPAAIKFLLQDDNDDQHAQLHDVKNTFLYHCRRCGDIYASRTELSAMPRCQNCRTDADRVKLPDDTLFNGVEGMYPLFCCVTCHHHWMIKGGQMSRCRMCQNNNMATPLIKPCMYGVGWIISRFLGRTPEPRNGHAPRPISVHPSSSSSHEAHRPFQPRIAPPKDRERDRDPRDLRDMMYDRFLDDIHAQPDKYELEFFTKNAERLRAFLPPQDVVSAATAWLCMTQPDIDKKTARDFVNTKMQNDQPNPEQTYFNCPFCNNNTKVTDSRRRLCDGGKEKIMHSIRGCINPDCNVHTTCHTHAVPLI